MISFHDLRSLSLGTLLQVRLPLSGDGSPYRQMDEVERQARALGAVSAVLEREYIDRDHMEDHAAFYASSLGDFPNVCRRVHFFSRTAATVRRTLGRITEGAARHGEEWLRTEARSFSRRAYLGFMVVRPLPGSPVGRTVIRPPRNCGVIAIESTDQEPIHVLVDTTVNERNTRFLAVVARHLALDLTRTLAGHLSDELGCLLIYDT